MTCSLSGGACQEVNKFNRNLGFSAVRMWYDIGTERLMCVTNVCVSSLIDKI